MKNNKFGLWIFLGILFILIIFLWSGYNSLVRLDESVKAKWANVESDYQRRSDLIPNLVNTVKGSANFEQKTLTDVIAARASATQLKVSADDLSPAKIEAYQKAQGQLSSALGKLLMITENYPQLRATEGFRDLQVQIEGTENRIKVSRNDFNDIVKDYNRKARSFPTVIIAKLMSFDVKGYFQVAEVAEKSPEVKF